MSEREKKLEAALRIARQVLQDNLTEIIWLKEMQQIDAALATPPTSEWNEAVEAAARSLVNDAEEFEGPDGFLFGVQPHLLHALDEALEKLDALKRKERP